MRGMKDVGAVLLALGKPGEDDAEAHEAEDASPEEMLEDAMGVLSDALKKGDKRAAAKAFRIALEVCSNAEGEADADDMEHEGEGE